MEQGRISGAQLCALHFMMVGGTSILNIPSITSASLHNDMWIAPLISSVFGIATAYIAFKLHEWYPGQTFVQYCDDIFGRWLGRCVSFLFMLITVFINGYIIRDYGEFVKQVFLTHTPMYVITGAIVLTGAFAVIAGLEVIGRFSLLVGPIFMLLVVCVFLLLIKDYEPLNILPFFNHDLVSMAKGSALPASWLVSLINASFFLPYVKGGRRAFKWLIWSVLILVGTMMLTSLTCLFLFGDLAGGINYPVFSASRYISIADFFAHVEAIVLALWMLGGFLEITTWFYSSVLGIAQWAKLQDYRPIVLPMGMLLVIVAYWVTGSNQEADSFFRTAAPVLIISYSMLLPLGVLGVAFIRRTWF